MDKILLSSGLSFIITFFSIPIIIQVAKEKKLFDEPDERKIHKAVIPTLGGLGLFAGFMISMLLGVSFSENKELQFFIASCLVIFFLGIKDDVLILSASKKFAGQVIAAGILVKFGGVQINNMQGFLGVHEIPHFAAVILTLLTIIVITNSFNLIDGVDGLAGSLGILTTVMFGIYFYYTHQLAYAVMAFALTGSLISFLIYNFPPAKIFMGDTGSLLVGLTNSVLVIKFINFSSSIDTNFPLASAPAIGFAILMVPLFDTLRVFSMRIMKRRSPFSPDRNHIHHFLLDLGFSHRKITFACLIANLFFIVIAALLRNTGTTILMGVLMSVAILLTSVIYYHRNNKKSGTKMAASENEIIKSHKVITYPSESIEVE